MEAGHLIRNLERLVRKYRIPGVQFALHRNGRTTAVQVGEQEYATGQGLTRSSQFPIGSITKACTATVVMILVADGELELDAPVVEYVPELASLPGHLSARLTLRHLLSHTGGLPDDDVQAVSPRGYLRDSCAGLAELQQPGAGFSYSNVGYVLAGCVVESVTGMTWREAVDAILLRPLGIPATFVEDSPAPAPVVSGHSVHLALGRTRPVEQTVTPAEAPVGGLAMSAVDLVTFGRLHLCRDDNAAPAILRHPARLAEMRQAVSCAEPFGLADGWGLGLALFRHERTDWWGHDGNSDGTSCHLRIDAESGTVVALTTNANTGFAMWKEFVGELHAGGIKVGDYVATSGTKRRRSSRTSLPINCAGSYVNGRTRYSVLTEDDGALHLTVDDEPVAELTLYDDLLFSMRNVTTGDSAHVGRFLCDPATRRIDRMQVGGRLAWRMC